MPHTQAIMFETLSTCFANKLLVQLQFLVVKSCDAATVYFDRSGRKYRDLGTIYQNSVIKSAKKKLNLVMQHYLKRVGQAVVAVGALLNLVWRVAVPVHGGKKYRIRKCDFELLHV